MAHRTIDTAEQIPVSSRAEWRRWLAKHHGQTDSVFVVTFRKTGRHAAQHVPYAELVEEALCFGWVDSLPRSLDADRTMLLMSPRKAKSVWSKLNRERVERLIAEKKMTPAGLAKVEAAKANGQWSVLDVSDSLEVPADLAAAFAKARQAKGFFDAFPPSSRRAILQWLHSAKQPETRAKRVVEIVNKAKDNLKANFPAGRNQGPRPKKP